MKRLKIAALVCTSVTLCATHGLTQVVSAQTPSVVVNQGDPILIQASPTTASKCTAGFIDKVAKRIWTAGHCGDNNATVFFSIKDAQSNTENIVPIGTLKHKFSVTLANAGVPLPNENARVDYYRTYDLAYVDFSQHPEVTGNNVFSGDRVYNPVVGDRVCRYGDTTGAELGNNRLVYCGEVMRLDERIIQTSDTASDFGDSGGPNWVPGKGYIGQTLGADIRSFFGVEYPVVKVYRHDVNANTVEYPSDEHYVVEDVPLAALFDKRVQSETLSATTFGANLPSPAEYETLLEQQQEQEAEAKRQIAEKTEELEEVQLQLAELEAAVNTALGNTTTDAATALTQRIAALREAAETANQQRLAAETRAANLATQIADLETEIARLRQDAATNATQIQQLEGEKQGLQTDLAAAQTELRDTKAVLAQRDQELTAAHAKIAELMRNAVDAARLLQTIADLNAAQQKIHILQAALAQARAQLNKQLATPKPTVTVTATAQPKPPVTVTATAQPKPPVTVTATAEPKPAVTITTTAPAPASLSSNNAQGTSPFTIIIGIVTFVLGVLAGLIPTVAEMFKHSRMKLPRLR